MKVARNILYWKKVTRNIFYWKEVTWNILYWKKITFTWSLFVVWVTLWLSVLALHVYCPVSVEPEVVLQRLFRCHRGLAHDTFVTLTFVLSFFILFWFLNSHKSLDFGRHFCEINTQNQELAEKLSMVRLRCDFQLFVSVVRIKRHLAP